MKENKRKYIIDKLMVPGFITYEKQEMILEESKKTGRSLLHVRLLAEKNLCIANVDDKNTIFQFFRADDKFCMRKRVDHMIFEHLGGNQWKLYLIEMKSSVGEKKWTEIKGQFRASYLVGQALAAMLEMDIAETVMYTTFERVQFTPSDTMPTARRSRSGRAMVRMKEEWNGGKFGLNFGKRISFAHNPVPMKRNAKGVLVGELVESDNGR